MGVAVTTENLAILFTDIVRATQLSHRQSPEDADEVRRGHFSILRQAVTEAGGKEVKNLGDGLMAVFGSASTALACAVAMQQGVDLDNRDRLHPAVGSGSASAVARSSRRTAITSATRSSRPPDCAPCATADRSWPPTSSGSQPVDAVGTSTGFSGS